MKENKLNKIVLEEDAFCKNQRLKQAMNSLKQ